MTPSVETKVAGWRDRFGAEDVQGEEFVHEAEWGRDREEAVDDEPMGDLE